jgi:hypothetical protein
MAVEVTSWSLAAWEITMARVRRADSSPTSRDRARRILNPRIFQMSNSRSKHEKISRFAKCLHPARQSPLCPGCDAKRIYWLTSACSGV